MAKLCVDYQIRSCVKYTPSWSERQRMFFNPFPNDNLDPSKLKEFTDNNFRFDENCRKFFKSLENTAGKGEIVCNKQFSFSHCVFKRLVLQTRKNQGLFGKGLKWLESTEPNNLCF